MRTALNAPGQWLEAFHFTGLWRGALGAALCFGGTAWAWSDHPAWRLAVSLWVGHALAFVGIAVVAREWHGRVGDGTAARAWPVLPLAAWIGGSAAGWAVDRSLGGEPAASAARAALQLAFCATLIGLPVMQSWTRRMARRRAEAERMRVQAELMSLQAQIEPHFLFNTLATLRSLVRQGSGQALPLLDGITGLLQSVLPQVREPQSRVERELRIVEQYLGIMAIRLGPRLVWRVDASPQALGVVLAPLLLQPLVENAVQHGIEPQDAGGEVRVSAECREGDLLLSVRNTGRALVAAGAATHGHGLALRNLRERLAALHGPRAHLSLTTDTEGATVAQLTLPLEA